MDRTVRALTDLAAVDDQLSGGEALIDGLAPALEERRAALREAIPGLFLAAYDALGRAGRRPWSFRSEARTVAAATCASRLS